MSVQTHTHAAWAQEENQCREDLASLPMVVREMARQFHLGASAANDILRPLCFGKRVQKPRDVVICPGGWFTSASVALRGARLVSEAPFSQDVLEIAQKTHTDTNMHPHILHPIHPPPPPRPLPPAPYL